MSQIEIQAIPLHGISWAPGPAGEIYIYKNQSKHREVAIKFKAAEAEIIRQMLSGISPEALGQAVAIHGSQRGFRYLRDLLGKFADAGLIHDSKFITWLERLRSDFTWPDAIATESLVRLILYPRRERHRYRSKFYWLVLTIGFVVAFYSVLRLAFGFSEFMGWRWPVDRMGSILIDWYMISFIGRSASALIRWLGVGVGLREPVQLSFDIDLLGPCLKTSDISRVERYKFEALIVQCISIGAIALPFALFPKISTFVFTMLFVLLEKNPFSRSQATEVLRNIYNLFFQNLEGTFEKIYEGIKWAWIGFCALWVVFGFFPLVSTTLNSSLWNDPDTRGAFRFLAGVTIGVVIIPIFSILSDIFGVWYRLRESEHGLIRRYWLRKEKSTSMMNIEWADKAQWQHLPFLRQFDPEIRDRLLDGARLASFSAGELVCSEGESTQSLYIVLAGGFLVRKRTARGRTKIVATLSPGAVFGEAAFFFQTPRTADVLASENSTVLEIPKLPGTSSIGGERGTELQTRIWLLQALMKNPLFHNLPTEVFDGLVTVGKKVNYNRSHVIFRENEPADSCYLIIQGNVSVFQKGHRIRNLGPGDIFGEVSLMNPGLLRTGTVACEEDTIAIRISAEEFRGILSRNWALAIEMERLAAQRLADDQQRSAHSQ